MKKIKMNLEKNKEINIDVKKINEVEEYISQIMRNSEYNFLSKQGTKKSIQFVSKRTMDLTEDAFFEIVEANKKHCRKSAGLYQQSLFGRYLEAKKEQDLGYIQDIFEKAKELRNNLKRVKKLKENKAFMKEWRRNFGRISPESVLKHNGKMRKINIIENLSM